MKTIYNAAELKAMMNQAKYMDGAAYVVGLVFGKPYVTRYASPSAIPYSVCGDGGVDYRGYWKNGQLCQFSTAKKIRYQNSAMGCE